MGDGFINDFGDSVGRSPDRGCQARNATAIAWIIAKEGLLNPGVRKPQRPKNSDPKLTLKPRTRNPEPRKKSRDFFFNRLNEARLKPPLNRQVGAFHQLFSHSAACTAWALQGYRAWGKGLGLGLVNTVLGYWVLVKEFNSSYHNRDLL